MRKILTLVVVATLSTMICAQKYKLELNLKMGAVYTQNITSKAVMEQTSNGKTQNSDISTTGKITYKVVGVKDSIYDLETRYESLSIKVKVNSDNSYLAISSEKKDKADMLSTALSGITNKPFKIMMSKSGKVVDMQNIESFFSTIFNDLNLDKDFKNQQIMDQLDKSFGNKTLKANLEKNFAIFPKLPVSVGDSWTSTSNYDLGLSARSETTYELLGIVDNCYLIKGTLKINSENKDEYKDLNGIQAKSDISGLYTSTTRIDKKTGWINEQSIKYDMTSKIKVKEMPQLPDGLTMDMKMTMDMLVNAK